MARSSRRASLLAAACLSLSSCATRPRAAEPSKRVDSANADPYVQGAALASPAPKSSERPAAGLEPPSAPPPTPRPPPLAACDEPTRWLAHVARESLEAAYCDACEERCDDGEMRFELTDRTGRVACEELDYARHAIAAEQGLPVRAPGWAAYFEARPDYAPRAAAELDAIALENVAWVERALAECRRREPPPPRHVLKVLRRYTAALAEGSARLPRRLFIDGQPAAPEELAGYQDSLRMYSLSPRTPIARVPDALGGARTYAVNLWTPQADCLNAHDPCDGFFGPEITLDRQLRVIALHVFAVG